MGQHLNGKGSMKILVNKIFDEQETIIRVKVPKKENMNY